MTKIKEHPAYNNPTIIEALCEIHFLLGKEQVWLNSFAGEFFKAIQTEFPTMEPQTEIGFQFDLAPQGFAHKTLPPKVRVRYKHKERNLVLQLGENLLTVNILPPYPHWFQVRKDVTESWNKLMRVLNPSIISRIGLRYVNSIEKESLNQHPGDWLKTNDYIPNAVIHSNPGFISRVEVHKDKENRVIVTLGENKPSTRKYGAIILDIDRIIEKQLSASSETLLQEMEKLHDDIWEIFNTSKTDKLETLLNRRN